MRDPYSILGVQRSATDEEIRSAYRKLARELHPDVNPGDTKAEERFKEVSAAYDILSDKSKRALFDEFGEEGLRSGFNPEQARQYRQWAGGFGGSGFGGAGPSGGYRVDFDPRGGPAGFDFGDLFGEMFGGGATRPRRGQDVLVRTTITLEQAIHGADIQVAVSGRDTPVKVRIPKGADDGSRLRVEGQGQPGSNGGPAGDLVIETRMEPHPYFERQGLDLFLKLPVTLAEAYRGTSVQVPTPSGHVKLRIPAGTQSGARLRLRGKGLTRSHTTGDMYAVIDVRLPDARNDELERALEAAQPLYPDLRRDISI